MVPNLRIAVGLMAWFLLGAWLWGRLGETAVPTRAEPTAQDSSPLGTTPPLGQFTPSLWQYATTPNRRVSLEFAQPWPVAQGDLLVWYDGTRPVCVIGHLERVDSNTEGTPTKPSPAQGATALVYPTLPVSLDGVQVSYQSTPQSLGWVLETLLPPQKRELVLSELHRVWVDHRQEIIAELQPVGEEMLKEALAVLREDLPPALARRREEFEALGVRYQEELVRRELAPLVQQEIWPIARKHGEPLANQIGQEIWNRVSLWRFAWRFAYDKSLQPSESLVNKEWKRFVDQEAVPILERHSDAMLSVLGAIVRGSLENPQVRQSFNESFNKLADDPQVQRLLGGVLRDAVFENPRMREVITRHLDQIEAALGRAARPFEPTLRRIGDLVFGTSKGGITPEFARVLRNQILQKDRRWFAVQFADKSSPAPGRSSSGLVLIKVRAGPAELTNANPFPWVSGNETGDFLLPEN